MFPFFSEKKDYSCVWWNTLVIPVLEKLRQEDVCEFKTGLGYIVSSGPA